MIFESSAVDSDRSLTVSDTFRPEWSNVPPSLPPEINAHNRSYDGCSNCFEFSVRSGIEGKKGFLAGAFITITSKNSI